MTFFVLTKEDESCFPVCLASASLTSARLGHLTQDLVKFTSLFPRWTPLWSSRGRHHSSEKQNFCVDLNYICEFTVPSLPFLFMKCFFGDVSFPGALEERRVVVLPQGECKRVMDKLKDVGSPCVIEVTASVDFQVRILISGEVLLLYVSLSVN